MQMENEMAILRFKYLWVVAMPITLAACSEQEKSAPRAPVSPVEKNIVYERSSDISMIVRGAQLYKQNCASCHGNNAQGADNWQKRDAQGKLPPPPLNGTGHAWHHPMTGLKQTIFFGTENIGGSMPGWKGKLSETQVDEILAWLQSKWPDEVYQAWARNDQRTRNQSTK